MWMQLLTNFIKNSQNKLEITRAMAVKMLLLGYRHQDIMPVLGVSSGFISKWKKAFFQHGIDGLKVKYKGSEGLLNKQQRAEVIKWLNTKQSWTLNELEYYITDQYGVVFESKQSYYDLFDEARISWKKTQVSNPQENPELVAKKKQEICELLEARRSEIESGELVVFMADECHLVWGDVCGYVWGKTNERVTVGVGNTRQRQTYFGALDYKTKEFLLYKAKTADSDTTIGFLEYLQAQRPEAKILIIWDGATYHYSKKIRNYLDSLNAEKAPEEWVITCEKFAPNAPQQNPVEDIWLKAKNFIREFYFFCHSFSVVKGLFEIAIECDIFDFDKLHKYGVFS